MAEEALDQTRLSLAIEVVEMACAKLARRTPT